MSRVAFSWSGLPQYAARLLRAALDAIPEDCDIVGSKPSVPVTGMERVLRKKVHWVDAAKPVTWRSLGLEMPRVFFQSGWRYPAFAALGREVKLNGGRVVGFSDAAWRGDWRQLIVGSLVFRARYRDHFDAMMVPGRQGEQLMRWLGMPGERIRLGMYGADPQLFTCADDLAQRPKTFLFVGRFVAVKNILPLVRAFMTFAERHPDWTLRLVGSGEQGVQIPAHPHILVEGFVQPEELAARFCKARFLVLPSRTEPWGLVVHEAALCGCGLILSDRVGSAADLAGADNSVRFRARDERDLLRALESAARFDSGRLRAAQAQSLALAAQFGPNRFAAEVATLVTRFTERA